MLSRVYASLYSTKSRVTLVLVSISLFLFLYLTFGGAARRKSTSKAMATETQVTAASCNTDAERSAYVISTSEVSKPEWTGSMFYRRAAPRDVTEKVLPTIVLLHGAAFSSKTWLDLGTLEFLSCHGYESFAFDLPSKGRSAELQGVDANNLIHYLRDKFQWSSFVIISPSMSGSYSLPFVTSGDTRGLVGFVPIAPAGIAAFKSKMSSVDVKTLHIRGEKDQSLGVAASSILRTIRGATDYVMKDAGHACYMNNPDEFHKVLLKFLDQIVAKPKH